MNPALELEDLFGHHRQAEAFRLQLAEDQRGGAYLITGPAGVGKTTFALACARAAACLAPQDGRPCGSCQSCRLAAAGTHSEITWIEPNGETTQIWQFWDRPGKPSGALESTLSFAPRIGAARVFIIERADTLTEGAANSILKVVEEPPPYVVFFLLSPAEARMLPTLVSRCQQIRLRPAHRSDLVDWLITSSGADPAEAERAAALAEGRVGLALHLLQEDMLTAQLAAAARWISETERMPGAQALMAAERLRELMKSAPRTGAGKGKRTKAAEIEEADDESGESVQRESIGRGSTGAVFDLLALVYSELAGMAEGRQPKVLASLTEIDSLHSVANLRSSSDWMRGAQTALAARRQVDMNGNVGLVTDDFVISRLVRRG